MSRTNEVQKHLEQLTKNQHQSDIVEPETTELWKRFLRVQQAVARSLSGNPIPEINRKFSTFSWSGYDAGIHDHNGTIKGTVYNIYLDLKIQGTSVDNQPGPEIDSHKGTTIDNQPRLEIDSQKNWKPTHKTEHDINISGGFTSADGREGVLEIQLKDGKPHFEAYWLSCLQDHFQLEQVINPQGNVFDVNKLPLNHANQAIIPGTNLTLEVQKNKQFSSSTRIPFPQVS